MRAALTRPTDELELADLPSKRAIGERLMVAAREQAEAGEVEQITAREGAAPVDIVAEVDGERATRALEPLIASALRTEAQATTLRAAGTRDLFAIERLALATPDPGVRVDNSFANEPSEALAGRSEVQVVTELSGLIGELGRAADPTVASWVVVRRTGLRAGLVFLAAESVVELNPTLLYYWSTLDQARPAVGSIPTVVDTPTNPAPANDWEVLMRWLDQADPTSWTNLGYGQSQTYDAGDTSTNPYSPLGCPCCGCSAFGLGNRHPAGGIAALLALALPFGAMFVVRRRQR